MANHASLLPVRVIFLAGEGLGPILCNFVYFCCIGCEKRACPPLEALFPAVPMYSPRFQLKLSKRKTQGGTVFIKALLPGRH